MFLNTLKPAAGSKKARKRVGRGIGSCLLYTSPSPRDQRPNLVFRLQL